MKIDSLIKSTQYIYELREDEEKKTQKSITEKKKENSISTKSGRVRWRRKPVRACVGSVDGC